MINIIKNNINLINTDIQDITNQINKFANKMNDIRNSVIHYEYEYNHYLSIFNSLTDDIFNKKDYNKAPLLFNNICCLWNITNNLEIAFEDYKYYLSYYFDNIEYNFKYDFSFIDGLYLELSHKYNSLVFCSRKVIINSFKSKKDIKDLINLLKAYFNKIGRN